MVNRCRVGAKQIGAISPERLRKMRILTYFRLDTLENLVHEEPFIEANYKELGIPVTPNFGMHKLNALELINKWNRLSAAQKGRFLYFID